MLSTGAATRCCKSLEEPPAHVVFILATTDPQKVLPDRSAAAPSTSSFHLLPADVLADHVRHVIAGRRPRAGRGRGRPRGPPGRRRAPRHAVGARPGVGDGRGGRAGPAGRGDPRGARRPRRRRRARGRGRRHRRRPGPACARRGAHRARCATAFPRRHGRPDRHLPPSRRERAAHLGAALGPAGLTRALEVLGEALVELAKKPDPRIVLEVALVRLRRPDADRSLDAVVERLERLERALAPTCHRSAGAAPAGRPPGRRQAAPARPRCRRRRAAAAQAEGGAARRLEPGPSWPRAPTASPAPSHQGHRPAAPRSGGPAARPPRAGRGRAGPRRPARGAPARTGGCVGGRSSPAETSSRWGGAAWSVEAAARGTKAIFSTGRGWVDGRRQGRRVRRWPTPDARPLREEAAPTSSRPWRPTSADRCPCRLVTDADVDGAARRRAGPAAPAPAIDGGRGGRSTSATSRTPRQPASAPSGCAEAFPGAQLVDDAPDRRHGPGRIPRAYAAAVADDLPPWRRPGCRRARRRPRRR